MICSLISIPIEEGNSLVLKMQSGKKGERFRQDWLSSQPILRKEPVPAKLTNSFRRKFQILRKTQVEVEDLAASAFHILEQNCFRCHGNEKKKEDLI